MDPHVGGFDEFCVKSWIGRFRAIGPVVFAHWPALGLSACSLIMATAVLRIRSFARKVGLIDEWLRAQPGRRGPPRLALESINTGRS